MASLPKLPKSARALAEHAVDFGRHYNRQKGQGKRTDLTSDQNDTKLNTSQRLAKEYGVGEATVKRAGQFAEAVEIVKAIPDRPGMARISAQAFHKTPCRARS